MVHEHKFNGSKVDGTSVYSWGVWKQSGGGSGCDYQVFQLLVRVATSHGLEKSACVSWVCTSVGNWQRKICSTKKQKLWLSRRCRISSINCVGLQSPSPVRFNRHSAQSASTICKLVKATFSSVHIRWQSAGTIGRLPDIGQCPDLAPRWCGNI